MVDDPTVPEAIAAWAIMGKVMLFTHIAYGADENQVTTAITDENGDVLLSEFRPIPEGYTWWFGELKSTEGGNPTPFPTDDTFFSILEIGVPSLMTMVGDTFQLETEAKDLVGAVNELKDTTVEGVYHVLSAVVISYDNIESGMRFQTPPIPVTAEFAGYVGYWTIVAGVVSDQDVAWSISSSAPMVSAIPNNEVFTLTAPHSDGETVGTIEVMVKDVASASNFNMYEMQTQLMELTAQVQRMQGLPAEIRVFITATPDHTPAHFPTQNPWARGSLDRIFTNWNQFQDWYSSNLQALSTVRIMRIYVSENLSSQPNPTLNFRAGCLHIFYGEIDLIVTKSVSRFARNTVDSLSTIRKLKENGTEVYFQKEEIWTFDGKGELLITIMSSLAQEEARGISENVKWGHRKRFADGKVSVPYKRFLGFDKGENGTLKINEEQAVTVRLIYKLFLEGGTPHSVASHLTAEGILTPSGKEVWSQTTVKAILTNEKYKGDALLQKNFTTDFLTKKQKINEGEVPQYYVENSHPYIIEPAVFDMVQQELLRRKTGKTRHSSVGIFASRIKCGTCSSWFGAKVWHSTSKYRRTIYQCNHKFKGDEKCGTPHFTEDSIKQLFVLAVNKLLADKEGIISNFATAKADLFGTADLEMERAELQREMTVTADLIQQCIEENARVALDQREYQERYDKLAVRFETAKARFEEVSELALDKKEREKRVEAFIAALAMQDGLIAEFDERLWFALVDFATVYTEDDVRFTFKSGLEM